eukprot:6196633-Pleurochrysis_carterae.AAC.1
MMTYTKLTKVSFAPREFRAQSPPLLLISGNLVSLPATHPYITGLFVTMDNNYDALKRLLCEPWDGTQGAEFLRRFAPDFEGALHTTQDKYSALYDHLTGNDPASSPVGPHVGTAPTGTRSQATNPSEEKYVESERDSYLRSKKLFGLIRLHVTDPAIRQELNTTVRGN